MHLTHEALEQRFNFHPANTREKQNRHELVRKVCLEVAESIVDITGAPTREQSLAITKLEEAMFWANAAIAREPDAPRDPTKAQT